MRYLTVTTSDALLANKNPLLSSLSTLFSLSTHRDTRYLLALSLCCFFALLLSIPSFAEVESADTSSFKHKASVKPNLNSSYLSSNPIDNTQLDALSFAELGRLNDADWTVMQNNQVFLTNDENRTLIKITIRNDESVDDEHFLELASNHVESASLYYFDTNRQSIVKLYQESGNSHRFNNRPINYRHIVYPIAIEAKQTATLLLQVDHHYPTRLKLTAWNETGFVNKLNRELIFFGMIYGSLLMIVIYNLFVYLTLKEKNHLLFFIFGSLTGLFISLQEGHFSQFIAPDMDWSKSVIFSFIAALMCFSFSFFSSYFLDIEKHSPITHQVILATGSICAVFLILLGFSDEQLIFSNISLLIILSLYSIAIWAGIKVWHKGITSAGFFSLAIFFSSLGLFLEYLSQLSITRLLSPSFSYATTGYTAMIFVFAYALADKMRLFQQDRLDASLKLVKLTEEKAQSNLEIYKSKLSEIQSEKEAQAAKHQLQAKSEFLTLMSHGIRTPMNSLMGVSELMKDTELTSKQLSYVNSITHSSNALLNVINDVLDFSQFESGQMELDSRLFNLEKVIDDCVNIFALSSNENNLDIIAYVSPSTPIQLKGDAEKIKQVCLNLLNQSSLQKGIKDLKLYVQPTGKKTVNSIELAFNLSFTGENLDLAFFESWQHKSTVFDNNDLGLTLSVSQQLIELMNGELTVNHESIKIDHEDTGLKKVSIMFTARLLRPHSNESLNIENRKALLKDRRILICHSNPDLIAVIQELTASWGMKCTTTHTPKEAGERLLFDKKPYQLLMIDKQQLTPELQLSIRQSNLENNYSTAISILAPAQFSLTKDEMKRKGIRCLFNLPFTTGLLYQTILTSMGIESSNEENEQGEISVLVAEDNAVNLMVIEGILKKQGLAPLSCVNGQEAINLANKLPGFDIIFMDCEMPEVDGFDATRAIRKEEALDENLRPTTIIGLSAHATSQSRLQAKKSGMDDFLTKPIKPEDIEQIIAQLKKSIDASEENE